MSINAHDWLCKLVLTCKHVKHSQVVWRRVSMEYPLTIGEMTFSPDEGMSVDHSQITRTSSSWDLLIKSVKPHHAGVYECQVTSNHLIAQLITLNVIGMYICLNRDSMVL